MQRQLISFQVICAIKVGDFIFVEKPQHSAANTEVIKWKGWGENMCTDVLLHSKTEGKILVLKYCLEEKMDSFFPLLV